MTLRGAALAVTAVLAACSGEPAPEPAPDPFDIGDGDHVGIEAPDESWTLERFSAAEDLTERSAFGPIVAFDVGDVGAAVATVVEVPAPVVESQGAYLGPFVRPAARAVDGRTVVVSGRGGVDPAAVVDRIGLEGGRPASDDLRAVGVLPEGWELPGDAVRFSARRRGRHGEMTAYLVDRREQAALRHLLVDDPNAYPPDASAPEAEVRPPRRVEVDGRTGWLGQTSPYDRVVVLDGEPGVALVGGGMLEDDELVALAAAVRAVDDDAWAASRRAWLEEVRVREEQAAEDDVRMGIFLARGRELWRERVGQTLHVLYEPGPGSDLDGRLCTGTVVIPLGWEGRRIGQSCALPPVPHVSAARSGQSDEVWGLATSDVAAVEVRSSDGVATARVVDAGGRLWWVADVPGEATDLTVIARDAGGRALQELAFVN